MRFLGSYLLHITFSPSPHLRPQSDESGSLELADLVPNRESIVVVSVKGYVKRMREETFVAQGRGTRGKAGAKLRDTGEGRGWGWWVFSVRE